MILYPRIEHALVHFWFFGKHRRRLSLDFLQKKLLLFSMNRFEFCCFSLYINIVSVIDSYILNGALVWKITSIVSQTEISVCLFK